MFIFNVITTVVLNLSAKHSHIQDLSSTR